MVFIPTSSTDVDGMPGFSEGNKYSVWLWKKETNFEYELNPEIIKGPSIFVKNESVMLGLKNSTLTKVDNLLDNDRLDVKCHPNPFSDKLYFEFTTLEDDNAVLELYNVRGQSIIKLLDKQVEGGVINRIEYAPTEIISGIYIYRLTLDKNVTVGKVIYN